MLSNFFIKFGFQRFCQSGCYLDFFFKKITEVFIRNVFIYAAQFFAEKFIIEYLTKNVFYNKIYYLNKLFGFNNLKYFDFFQNIISYFFYFIFLICLFIFI